MKNKILKKLEEIEKKYNIEILYACESGSRAWGFESKDSDYDIRFIYVHKLDWYLTIQDHRNVIEEMVGDLDLVGWELKKSFQLLVKGNPPLLEWLNSPIVYKNNKTFTKDLNSLAKSYFSPKTSIYHYLHMAKGNYNQYIKNKTYVEYKKYLYVLRPILSCLYVQTKGSIPPTAMKASISFLEGHKAYSDLVELIKVKKTGRELDLMPANKNFNRFIEENIVFLELYVADLKSNKLDLSKIDKVLKRYILEYSYGRR